MVDELRLVFDGEADQDGLLVGEDVDTLSAGAYAGEHLGGAVVVEEASGGAELDVGMETGFWSPR